LRLSQEPKAPVPIPADREPPVAVKRAPGMLRIDILENSEHSKLARSTEFAVNRLCPSRMIDAELRSITNGEFCVIVRLDKERTTSALEIRTEFALLVPMRLSKL
jgi:hypothetical protein